MTGLRNSPARAAISITLACAIAFSFAVACGGGDDFPAPPRRASTPTGPSASAGTPPPADAPVANAYRADRVFENISVEQMVGMYAVPDDRAHAVVLARTGRAYLVDLTDATVEPTVFLDLGDRLIDNPRTEEGLLGLAFAPDFASSGTFYVNYTAGDPRRNVISRFVARDNLADPSSERVILEIEQPFANHNGGAMVFGRDGYLYIASGDGGSAGDPRGNGQKTDTLLGKILRIDVSAESYASPPDNPFAGGGGRPEIWAYGLRNPWRLTADRETGELWASDAGQSGWEEIDRIARGGNYGWNIMEGNDCFRRDSCDRDGLLAPRAVYPTADGCAVIGGYVYRGQRLPELRRWYVYGDFCSGRLFAVDTSDDDSPPVMLADTGRSITSFFEDAAGEVYLVTFDRAIYGISR